MKSVLKLLSIFHRNKSSSRSSDNMAGVGDGSKESKKGRTNRNHTTKPNQPPFLTSGTEDRGFSELLQSKNFPVISSVLFLAVADFCYLRERKKIKWYI